MSIANFDLPTGHEPLPRIDAAGVDRVRQAKQEAIDALATALSTPDLQALRTQVEAAEDAHAALQEEYANGNRAIAQAAATGDADKLADISLRMQKLPTLILSADFATVDAQLALAEAERGPHAELIETYNRERIAPLQAELARLQAEVRAADAQRRYVHERAEAVRDKRLGLLQRRREVIAQLQHAATPRRMK